MWTGYFLGGSKWRWGGEEILEWGEGGGNGGMRGGLVT
jgi:hypothetical protein